MKPLEVIDVQVRCSCRCFGVCNHRIKNASPSEPSYRRVTPLQGTGVLHLYISVYLVLYDGAESPENGLNRCVFRVHPHE